MMYKQATENQSQPNKQQPEQNQNQYRYQRRYPKFSSVRLSLDNIAALKNRATRFNQTIDDIVTIALNQLSYYEKLGYPEPQTDGGSF